MRGGQEVRAEIGPAADLRRQGRLALRRRAGQLGVPRASAETGHPHRRADGERQVGARARARRAACAAPSSTPIPCRSIASFTFSPRGRRGRRGSARRIASTAWSPAAEAYSVGRWLDDAARAIEEAHDAGQAADPGRRHRPLFQGADRGPGRRSPTSPPRSARYWRDEAERLGAEALHRGSAARDPAMAARLRPSRPAADRARARGDRRHRRLARGVAGRERAAPCSRRRGVLKLVIAPEREPLYAAIDARFDRMLEAGRDRGGAALLAPRPRSTALPAMRAHGVRELAAYLAGTAQPRGGGRQGQDRDAAATPSAR